MFELLKYNLSNLAGPKLNKSKTEGLWLGRNAYQQHGCTIQDIKWPTKPIRCLSIYLPGGRGEQDNLNWWAKRKNVETVFNSWKKRNLTLSREITIIKSLIVPTIFIPYIS